MSQRSKGGLGKISGQELTKGAELMLGVSMKTYIRDVDTIRRERGVAYRPGTCQHVSVRGSPEEEEAQ